MLDEIPSQKMQKIRRINILPILNPSKFIEMPLQDAITVKIKQRNFISNLLRELPQLPDNFHHLRRVKDGIHVLVELGFVPKNSNLELIEKIIGERPDVFLVKVPSFKPRTIWQYNQALQHWVTTFRKNDELESKIAGTFFDGDQVMDLQKLFTRAEIIRGAIFHDPKTKFTIEGERDKGRVLQHPVMAAIEKLASHQKTNMHPNQNFINRCTKASNCDYALTEVNEFKQSLAKASSDPDHGAKELSNMHNSLKKQYLGTGFDVFLDEEPCTQCAMALVHCRVKRVFFGRLNPRVGALISKWRLQDLEQLNHHYEVFQIKDIDNDYSPSIEAN